MDIKYFELTFKNFNSISEDDQKERIEKFHSFIKNIGIKISLTKPISKVLSKESMQEEIESKVLSDVKKDMMLSYIKTVMPETIVTTPMYAKVKTCDVLNFKTMASEFFQVEEVSERDISYVTSLFMNEVNSFWYTLRYLRPLQPLELWDL